MGGHRRHDDYAFRCIPPSDWKSQLTAEIQADNRRIKRRALRRTVLRAAAISVAVIVAAGYLVVMPGLAWINAGFGLAVSGRLPISNYHARTE